MKTLGDLVKKYGDTIDKSNWFSFPAEDQLIIKRAEDKEPPEGDSQEIDKPESE